MNRTIKDNRGRVWQYNDAEGCWSHGKHIVGCAPRNERRWQIWNGPDAGAYEFASLRAAMNSCR